MARPTIQDIGPAPSLSDPATFPARADATLGKLGQLVSEVNALATWLETELLGQVGNGSTAAPSMAFASDPDTGFYRPSPNQIGHAIGGVRRALLTSSFFTIYPIAYAGNQFGGHEISTTDGKWKARVALESDASGSSDLGIYAPSDEIGGMQRMLFLQGGGNVNAGVRFYADNVERARITKEKFQIDVPITGAAVTQTASDPTPGRLLKVADYGLGSLVPTPVINDFTADIAPGFYGALGGSGGAVGGPDPLGWQATVIVGRGQNNRTSFLYMRSAGANSSVWSGVRSAATGAVDWVAVTPQRGSGPNGEWVRFADGTQMCWSPIFSADTNTAIGALYKWAATQVWTFPAAFINSPNVYAAGTTNAGTCMAAVQLTSSTKTELGAISTHVQTARGVTAFAIGRYY